MLHVRAKNSWNFSPLKMGTYSVSLISIETDLVNMTDAYSWENGTSDTGGSFDAHVLLWIQELYVCCAMGLILLYAYLIWALYVCETPEMRFVKSRDDKSVRDLGDNGNTYCGETTPVYLKSVGISAEKWRGRLVTVEPPKDTTQQREWAVKWLAALEVKKGENWPV